MHTGNKTFPFEKNGDIINGPHSIHKEQEIGMLRLTSLRALRTAHGGKRSSQNALETEKSHLKAKTEDWTLRKTRKFLPLQSRAGKQPSRKICLEIPLHQGQRHIAQEAQKIVTRRIVKKERC